jgi:hypothetical protein
MPPDKVRPLQLGSGEGAEEKAPGDGLPAASLSPAGKTAQERLLAQIQKALDGPVRCGACRRPLSSLRSILLGCGPVCWAKRGSGGVS